MPRRIPFYVLDAFADRPFSGNPAGVFLDADSLTAEEMRKLAAEVSLESAFVLRGEAGADFGVRYFTGTMEIPLCGHATVAAGTALVHAGRCSGAGRELRLRTGVGLLTARLETRAGGVDVTLFQNRPEFGTPLSDGQAAEVAAALGCTPDAIAGTGLPVQRVSTGSPWLFAPVTSRATVDAAPADLEGIVRLSRELDTLGVYVFVPESTPGGEVSTWGRCFAPIAGLNEDPVTGSASGALGCYLRAHGRLTPDEGGAARFLARQGYAGGRGGDVRVAVGSEDGEVVSVAVTGSALLVAEGAVVL